MNKPTKLQKSAEKGNWLWCGTEGQTHVELAGKIMQQEHYVCGA